MKRPHARSPQSRLAKAEADLALAQLERLKALARLAETPADPAIADELEAIGYEIDELQRAISRHERDRLDLEAAQSTVGRAQALKGARDRAQALKANQTRRLELAQEAMATIELLGPMFTEYSALANESSVAAHGLLRGFSDASVSMSDGSGLALLGEAIGHGLCRAGLPSLPIPLRPTMELSAPASGGTPPEAILAAMRTSFERLNSRIALHLDSQAAALTQTTNPTPSEVAA